eukprot:SAG11_NODE_34312_length_272_cov_1.491329_1_plen_24_part_01
MYRYSGTTRTAVTRTAVHWYTGNT